MTPTAMIFQLYFASVSSPNSFDVAASRRWVAVVLIFDEGRFFFFFSVFVLGEDGYNGASFIKGKRPARGYVAQFF